ncbi:uncharacterized protein EI90DRAFT_88055 [Cantharellus anzutake]|uniref:uncharacterized protein n=1 Tax=Cantharellus anzutake TaxID=1750568 RepID=UPI0019066557|nr:uncharacterized protein EI90DRAFT_88055 [Cantharellus anzutake]KAF8336932.1 hypothetical protein EI90DRAFT_88055 [Cantharellus anzutake]
MHTLRFSYRRVSCSLGMVKAAGINVPYFGLAFHARCYETVRIRGARLYNTAHPPIPHPRGPHTSHRVDLGPLRARKVLYSAWFQMASWKPVYVWTNLGYQPLVLNGHVR